MAPLAWRASLLSSRHGKDVFLVVHPIMSLHRLMEWNLTEEQFEVSVEQISHHMAILVDHDKNVVELLPGSLGAEYPIGETPRQASMFINQFMDVKGDFLKGKF